MSTQDVTNYPHDDESSLTWWITMLDNCCQSTSRQGIFIGAPKVVSAAKKSIVTLLCEFSYRIIASHKLVSTCNSLYQFVHTWSPKSRTFQIWTRLLHPHQLKLWGNEDSMMDYVHCILLPILATINIQLRKSWSYHIATQPWHYLITLLQVVWKTIIAMIGCRAL